MSSAISPSSTIRIRKPRRCSWCGEMMRKGEEAETYPFIFEGEIDHVTAHPECKIYGIDEYDYGEGFELYANPRPTTQTEEGK